MSAPGTLSAALAFVPNWWQETTDAGAFDALLARWGRACGWRACGFAWTGETGPVVKTAQAGVAIDAPGALEMPDALRRLKSGESTVLYSIPGTTGRVFASVHPSAARSAFCGRRRPPASRGSTANGPTSRLVGKTVERAPSLAAIIGPVIDPERLYQRLGDTAAIAGRMAHDFDNLLQGIIGFSDLALPLLPPGSQPANYVAEIGKVGQRGITFTQQLHHLSRSGQVKPTPGAVGLATKEEARLKVAAHNNVRIEKDLSPNLPPVAMEAGPLQSVLGHLLANAVEACPAGGVVRVTARPVELSETDARGYLGRVGVGGHLQVTVTDTGLGIKPEVRRRLFVEPFYTTKVRHRGLGLAIAYRVLCSHRGGILIENVPSPGTGTQVRVVLPLAAARPPAIHSAHVAANAVGG